MSDDDEETWRRKREESQRRRDRMNRPAPVVRPPTTDPIPVMGDDDITSPSALMERAPNDAERALARRLRGESDDPIDAIANAIGKLAHRIDRLQREGDSGNKERRQQLDELLALPRSVRADVDELMKGAAFRSKLLWWSAAFVVAGIVAFGGFLYSRGAAEEAIRMRLEYLERDAHDRDRQPRWPTPTPTPSTAKATP